jgi:glutamate-1-semialdehyde 2,1-aminomutase
MEAAQKSFISSTFWTERIGPSAAIKTLEVMQREKSWEKISATGEHIKSKWLSLAQLHNLGITISGLKALPTFSFKSKNNLAYKTFITQEMLKKGYLASNIIYVSTVHTPEVLEKYFDALDDIFKKIKECEESLNILDILEGPICHSGFSRLN